MCTDRFREISSVSKKIACKPPERKSVEVKVTSGFGVVSQKVSLMSLEVVFEGSVPGQHADWTVYPGDRVYLRGECVKHVWAGEVFEVDGKEFVLVPGELICLLERAM